MKNTKELVKEVERDLVVNIALSVKYGRIDLKVARQIAKQFLSGYPYKNKQELFRKIDYLSEKHMLVRKVYVKHVPNYKDEETREVLIEVRKYMNRGEIDEAIIIAKGGIYG